MCFAQFWGGYVRNWRLSEQYCPLFCTRVLAKITRQLFLTEVLSQFPIPNFQNKYQRIRFTTSRILVQLLPNSHLLYP